LVGVMLYSCATPSLTTHKTVSISPFFTAAGLLDTGIVGNDLSHVAYAHTTAHITASFTVPGLTTEPVNELLSTICMGMGTISEGTLGICRGRSSVVEYLIPVLLLMPLPNCRQTVSRL